MPHERTALAEAAPGVSGLAPEVGPTASLSVVTTTCAARICAVVQGRNNLGVRLVIGIRCDRESEEGIGLD